MTEADIQNALYFYCASKSHHFINPNSCVFAWESDLISVTKAGIVHEFEIKVSLSDFRADARKDRAKWLVNPERVLYEGMRTERRYNLSRPNYFYYATPAGLVKPEECPPYAGLIWITIDKYGKPHTNIQKRATLIHTGKLEDKARWQLARSVMYRYWRQRIKDAYERPNIAVNE